jgi:hypothetical protein
MKLKVLIPLLLLIFLCQEAISCPIYLVGKIKVVDEHGGVIQNAKIWGYRGLNDSFVLRKGRL